MFHKTIIQTILIVLVLSLAACSTEQAKTSSAAPTQETKQQAVGPRTEVPVAEQPPKMSAKPAESGSKNVKKTTTEEPCAPANILAKIGDKLLTEEQARWIMVTPEGEPLNPMAKKRVVDTWLKIELFGDAAVRQGLDKSEKMKFIADFAWKQVCAFEYVQYLRRQVMPTEANILDYYEKNKETDFRIKEPPRMDFTHIRIGTIEEANSVLEKLKQGQDISELAKTFSTDPDASRGGKVTDAIERVVQRRYSDEFLQAINNASPGDIIGPIKLRDGSYDIARVDGKRTGFIRPFNEVKEYIKQLLAGGLQGDIVNKAYESLKEKYAAKSFVEEAEPSTQ